MVDPFNSAGLEPTTLAEGLARRKNVPYASCSREHLNEYATVHNLRHAVPELCAHIAPEAREDPLLQRLARLGCQTTMKLVHLGYPDQEWESGTKDIDFSRDAVQKR